MPTVVRKSSVNSFEARREILHAVSWQVQSSIWSPPTDVYETDDAYAVRVEIAGMHEDDFEVAMENNTLLISGYRPDMLERRAYHQMEIRFGKFATAIGLPNPVDIDHAVA
ncbi:MAG: Hsp20/alpha crystallin family protein, partial [Anaerolineales bacterium]|nr:Hsp20/alpha crystallin family protein [Anaerolineales bacterium]